MAFKHKGISSLPLSLLAREILEDLTIRMLKGKDLNVTWIQLAGAFGVAVEDVTLAIDELAPMYIVGSESNWGNGLSLAGGFCLRFDRYLSDQEVLNFDEPEPTKTKRDEIGRDTVTDGDASSEAVVVCNESGEFELTITYFTDPFDDGTVKVDNMPFGSRAEAWEFFDQWCKPAVSSVGIWFGPGGDSVWTIALESYAILRLMACENNLEAYDLQPFIEGQESEDYIIQDILVELAGVTDAKPVGFSFDSIQFESDVRSALAYALAQVVPEPAADEPPKRKRGRPKKGTVTIAEIVDSPPNGANIRAGMGDQ